MFTIRTALPTDWPFWHALDGRLDRALFERKCAAGECYVAEADGTAAGLLRWNLFWDEVPFCTLLIVDKARRGRGLGAALTARWEADLRAAGFDMAMTSTQADEPAQHFWRRLGYRDAGGFVVDVPGHEQPLEIVMIKALGAGT